MSDPGTNNKSAAGWRNRWGLIVCMILAVAFIALGVAYKYTGDFSGLATWGVRK
jgi:hypothetical protein